MTGVVRRAEASDLASMLDMEEQRRSQYAHYQPRFWNPAAHQRLAQSRYFTRLLETPEVLLEVNERDARLLGFIAAQAVIVCGHLDQPKREMLFSAGATLASEWFFQEL